MAVDKQPNLPNPEGGGPHTSYLTALVRKLTEILRNYAKDINSLVVMWKTTAAGALLAGYTSLGIGTGASSIGFAGFGSLTLNGTSGSLMRFRVGNVDVGQIAVTTVGAFYIDTINLAPIVFRINNGTEVGRFATDGTLLVNGVTSASSNNGRVLAFGAANYFTYIAESQPSAGTFYHMDLRNNLGASNGVISSTAGVTTYSTTSDRRKKKNIKPALTALPLLLKFKVVQHDWNDYPGHIDYTTIAQDEFAVFPSGVVRGGPGDQALDDGTGDFVPAGCMPWSVDHSKKVPLLVKAIQEQQAQIAALQTANTGLLAKLHQLAPLLF